MISNVFKAIVDPKVGYMDRVSSVRSYFRTNDQGKLNHLKQYEQYQAIFSVKDMQLFSFLLMPLLCDVRCCVRESPMLMMINHRHTAAARSSWCGGRG